MEPPEKSSFSSRSATIAASIAALSYLGIVLVLWMPFNLHSGLPSETGFVYTSESTPWWYGFLLAADFLRIHISNFFQVSYLLGEFSGFRGSFVPYQIVYAALWWARAFLMFIIARRFLPGHNFLCYLIGAFTLVHASDWALQWVGQLHQFGFIFYMLLAFYLLILTFENRSRIEIGLLLCLSALCEHLSLWSYESQMIIVLAAPLLLLWRFKSWKKWLARVMIWYLLPVIYVVQAAITYARSPGRTYQESILRKTWSVQSVLSDWWFNISASLKFWSWPGSLPPRDSEALLAWIAVAIFLGGVVLLLCYRPAAEPAASWRVFGIVMCIGAFLVVFSFPAYLILDSARSLWRTQFLSGLGAALMFAAAVGLCTRFLRRRWLRFAVAAALAVPIVWNGSFSALKKGAMQRSIWDRHRQAMAAVIRAAPQLQPGTLVILMNVPENADPCVGNNMWFDLALRLAYPRTAVAGACFYEGGVPAPGNTPSTIDGRTWRLEYGTLVPEITAAQILVIDYATLRVAPRLPDFLHATEDAARMYDPAARVAGTTPSERAVRRYGPFG